MEPTLPENVAPTELSAKPPTPGGLPQQSSGSSPDMELNPTCLYRNRAMCPCASVCAVPTRSAAVSLACFSAWVAPGASETSRRLAAALSSGAAAIGYSGNRSSPPCGYWTGNFAILRDTLCPAVLSENMFMDNVADLAFLKSPRSVEILAALHAKVLAEIIPDI